MITEREQKIKLLWEQAQRCARALDSALSIKNKEAIKIHQAALVSLLNDLDREIKENKNGKNT